MTLLPLPAIKRGVTSINKLKKLRVNPPIYAPKINKTVLPSRIGLNDYKALCDVRINIENTKQFYKCPSLLYKLVYNLNCYGICLINLNGFDNTTFGHRKLLQKNMYDLKPLFGETAFHEKSDKINGILKIDPRVPNSINVANTSICHPPHTDGAFNKRPEKIVTIAAEHCAINGGLTTLICAQSMLQSVLKDINYNENIINTLFDKDAIEIGRKLPQNNIKNEPVYDIVTSQQSVLSYLHEYDDDNIDECDNNDDIQHYYHKNDNLRLVYHGNPSYLKNIRDEIRKVWDLMTKYCQNDENLFKFKLEPGQILLIDNTSFLHGRTPYDQKELRVLHRLNFYHNGLLRTSVKLGINKHTIN